MKRRKKEPPGMTAGKAFFRPYYQIRVDWNRATKKIDNPYSD